MQVIVKKWGNSAAVRIPSSVLAASGLKIDQPVEVREEAGCVVIEPVTSKEYDLAVLLAGITPENIHEEVDFGATVGQELI
jgi:antitoxin MazE